MSEDPFCFDIFFRLEIKWSITELHKTFYCAHENACTSGKDRQECGAIIHTSIRVGYERGLGGGCLQAAISTS